MPIATTAGVAAAIGAVGSIAGAAIQSGSVSGASNSARQVSGETVNQAIQNYSPYYYPGVSSYNNMASLLGLNGTDAANTAMSTFKASPGYQYQVSEGLKAVDAGAASKGLLHSGATLKAEQTLGSNLADQDFSNYFSNLNTLSQTGLSALNNYENVATGQATNQENILTSAGKQDATIYGSAASGVASALKSSNALSGIFDSGTTQTSGSGASYNSSGYSASDIAAINNPYNY